MLGSVAADRSRLLRRIEQLAPELCQLALRLHDHPETGDQEFLAQAWISEIIVRHAGVEVERGMGGVPTALRARIGAAASPRVAVLAEYDALPEIGHACGHNLIAAAAVGAFLGLADQAQELQGTVELLGTPAEEGGGGKIRLLKAGVFSGLNAAMMIHPLDRDLLAHPALACKKVRMEFHGVPAHAAAAPWQGKSALTACLDCLRLVDSQRVHLRDGVRVHGVVRDGGQAVNIIPEHASCEFSVRAPSRAELERVASIVERCGRAAALASDVSLETELTEGYQDLVNNLTLARRFGEHLAKLGHRPRVEDPSVGAASTDMGDVSHVVAAIHPYLAICDPGSAVWHERRFAECARSERALLAMLDGAKAMADSLADLLEDPALLTAVEREFAESGARS
jgi:amidohydrolase